MVYFTNEKKLKNPDKRVSVETNNSHFSRLSVNSKSQRREGQKIPNTKVHEWKARQKDRIKPDDTASYNLEKRQRRTFSVSILSCQ